MGEERRHEGGMGHGFVVPLVFLGGGGGGWNSWGKGRIWKYMQMYVCTRKVGRMKNEKRSYPDRQTGSLRKKKSNLSLHPLIPKPSPSPLKARGILFPTPTPDFLNQPTQNPPFAILPLLLHRAELLPLVQSPFRAREGRLAAIQQDP